MTIGLLPRPIRLQNREPDVSWKGDVQPVPLHRSRVIFAGSRTRGYQVPADVEYRRTLQTLWVAARLNRPLEGDLACSMVFAGKGRRPDVSNLAKAVEDAGNGVLWEDDGQIRDLAARILDWGKNVRPFVAFDIWRL